MRERLRDGWRNCSRSGISPSSNSTTIRSLCTWQCVTQRHSGQGAPAGGRRERKGASEQSDTLGNENSTVIRPTQSWVWNQRSASGAGYREYLPLTTLSPEFQFIWPVHTHRSAMTALWSTGQMGRSYGSEVVRRQDLVA